MSTKIVENVPLAFGSTVGKPIKVIVFIEIIKISTEIIFAYRTSFVPK